MIHILTFHRAINYGAVLQCYALYSVMQVFEKCDVIDFDGRSNKSNGSIFSGINSMLTWNRRRIKRIKFSKFIRDNLTLSDKYNSYTDLRSYRWNTNDKFCVGSDQVWNWDLIRDKDAYALRFAPKRAVKFSYAASVGRDLDADHAKQLIDNIQILSGISIRESSTCETLRAHGVCCLQHIDPVFLLTKEKWEIVSTPVKNENTPFVLIYLLQRDENILRAAVTYAKERHLRIVYIAPGLRRDIKAEYALKSGPDEFLRYFLKAEAVFTNSFHGVSFSILFNKQFYFAFLQAGAKTNNRLQDITEMFHLSSQRIQSGHFKESKIDYDTVNNEIARKRQEALCYIRSMLMIGEDRIGSEENSVDTQDI